MYEFRLPQNGHFEENTFWTITIPSLYTIVYVRKLNDSVRVLENDNKQYCIVWGIRVKCVGCIESPGGGRRQPWLSPTVSQCQLIVSEASIVFMRNLRNQLNRVRFGSSFSCPPHLSQALELEVRNKSMQFHGRSPTKDWDFLNS